MYDSYVVNEEANYKEFETVISKFITSVRYKRLNEYTTYCYITIADALVIEGKMYGLAEPKISAKLAYENAVMRLQHIFNQVKKGNINEYTIE